MTLPPDSYDVLMKIVNSRCGDLNATWWTSDTERMEPLIEVGFIVRVADEVVAGYTYRLTDKGKLVAILVS